jgi:histone deacetylase 1/2
MIVVKRILRYIHHTTMFGLPLRSNPSTVHVGFLDVDWADSLDDRRSTGGHAVLFGSNLIAWSTRK